MSYLYFSIIFFSFFFSIPLAIGQLSTKLQTLSELPINQFEQKFPPLKKEITGFLKTKQSQCQSLPINSSSERKSCFSELKELEKENISSEYRAKKRFLESLHQKQLDSLKLAMENALKEIENKK